jgi:CubicO group peptidase (beta-lactamase class C family)
MPHRFHLPRALSLRHALVAACLLLPVGWIQAAPPVAAPVVLPSLEQVLDAEKLREMDAEIRQAVADGRLVGAVLWVERLGRAHQVAVGHRALQPQPEPMTQDTLFDLASITKVVATAAAAMLGVQRGVMALDDPVSRYLPSFSGEGREQVTIRHLLLHSSGLQATLNGTRPPLSRSPSQALELACRETLRSKPGSAFAYSSVGSMLLAMAIEKAVAKPFEVFCREEIFQPLGMSDTCFRPGAALLPRVAPSSAPARGLVDDHIAREMGGVAGHASLFSTTADLARFARMMLAGGSLEGRQLFTPATVALMTSVQTPPNLRSPDAGNLPVKRGLGWDIHTPYRMPPHDYSLARGALFPIGSYGHTGWTGQMLWIDPHSKTFVIFLCNRYGPQGRDSRAEVYQLHHRLSTLAAQAVRGVDFSALKSLQP